MVFWGWLIFVFLGGGFLGMLAVSLTASTRINELILGNRKLRDQRDEAVKDAKNYRELLKENKITKTLVTPTKKTAEELKKLGVKIKVDQ